MSKKFCHEQKVTNDDGEKSDCDNCKREVHGICVIAGMKSMYVDTCKNMHDRCRYWMRRK